MKISVIIATYNHSGALKQAIESVLNNNYPDFELIIADQSENDETKKLVSEYIKDNNRIKYLYSTVRGKSRSLNSGIKETKGEIIALTDDDCVVAQDWIEKMTSVFELHPDAVIVLGEVIPGKHNPSIEMIPSCRSRNRRYSGALAMKYGIGIGANMSIKRWVFEKVGYFDENIGPGTDIGPSDDWDFIYRTLAKGYAIYDTDLVKVEHNGSRKFNEAKKLWRSYQISTTAFLVKNLRCGDFDALWVLIGTTWRKFYELVWKVVSTPKPKYSQAFVRSKLDKVSYFLFGIVQLLLCTLIGILESFKYYVDKDRKLFIEK